MGNCGCGGSSNVYKPAGQTAAAKTNVVPVGNGFPAVWNGPKPKSK